VVKNCNFDHCACESGKSQGGSIFHNIRQDGSTIYDGGDSGEYAKFPSGTGYSTSTTTRIEGCDFKDCYAEGGSGGTVESDSIQTTVINCSFDGSYSNKNNANGGALNILHNSSENKVYDNSFLTVIGTTFNGCKTQVGSSNGGAICDQNSKTVTISDCDFSNCESNDGGAIRAKRTTTISILGSRFKDCAAKDNGAAVYAAAKTMTISDTYTDNDSGSSVTKESYFKDCSAPHYGGVYQTGNDSESIVTVNNVYFDNCKASSSGGGALYVSARSMSITGTARAKEDDPYTFQNCSANSGGGVYHSPQVSLIET
jgi:hypothetical protein